MIRLVDSNRKSFFIMGGILILSSCSFFSFDPQMGPETGKPSDAMPPYEGYIARPNSIEWVIEKQEGKLTVTAPPGTIRSTRANPVSDLVLKIVNSSLSSMQLAQLHGKGVLDGLQLGDLPVQADGSVRGSVAVSSLPKEMIAAYLQNDRNEVWIPKILGPTTVVYSDHLEPRPVVSGVYGCRSDVLGWSSAEKLKLHFQPAFEPQVKFLNDGTVIAIFREDGSATKRLYSSTFSTQKGWGSQKLIIQSPDLLPFVELAVSGDDRAAVTWDQREPIPGTIRFKRRSWISHYNPVLDSWSPPKPLGVDDPNTSSDTALVNYVKGGLWLTFHENDGTSDQVFQFFNRDGALLSESELDSPIQFPQMSIASNGIGLLTGWNETNNSITGFTVPDSITRFSPARGPSSRSGNFLRSNPSGNALLVWETAATIGADGFREGQIQWNSYSHSNNVSFGATRILGEYRISESSSVANPSGLSMEANEDLTQALAYWKASDTVTRYASFKQDRWWLAASPPAFLSGGNSSVHSLAIDRKSGRMALTLLGQLGENFWLWVSRYDPKFGWGPCSELVAAGDFHPPEPGYQGIVTAINSKGEVVVVWPQRDHLGVNSIFYSYYAPREF